MNQPYVFLTENGGAKWTLLVAGLPNDDVARVIEEDPSTENLLFLGTETGLYISLNQGKNWTKAHHGLPTVSIYDIEIHPRENDLILGTHGRGIYILDDISPLQYLAKVPLSNQVIQIPTQRPTTDWLNLSRGGQRGHFLFQGENPKNIRNTSNVPRATFEVDVPITFIINDIKIDSVDVTIYNEPKTLSFSKRIACHQGINRWYWDRKFHIAPFSEADMQVINTFFEQASQVELKRSSAYVKKLFEAAPTLVQKRKVLETANASHFNYQLPSYLYTSKAEVGTYFFSITYGDKIQKSTFVIEADRLE